MITLVLDKGAKKRFGDRNFKFLEGKKPLTDLLDPPLIIKQYNGQSTKLVYNMNLILLTNYDSCKLY